LSRAHAPILCFAALLDAAWCSSDQNAPTVMAHNCAAS
jgi:hypothetical protein